MELIIIEGGAQTTITPRQITAEDLIRSAIQRNVKSVQDGTPSTEGWSLDLLNWIDRASAISILQRIHKSVKFAKLEDTDIRLNRFGEKMSNFNRHDSWPAWLILVPKLTLLCMSSILIPAIILIYFLIWLTTQPEPVSLQTVAGILGVTFLNLVVFIQTLRGSIAKKRTDLTVVREIKELSHSYRVKMTKEIEDFEKRIDQDYGFYLKVLIDEMELILQSLSEEREKVRLDLQPLVYTPIQEVRDQIGSIELQLTNFHKLKNELSETEYLNTKESLKSKCRILKGSLPGLLSLKDVAELELGVFDKTSETVRATIKDLKGQRQAFLSKEQLLKEVNESLGSNEIGSDFAKQSNYNRELTKTLNRLKALNEAVSQIANAAEESIKSLPEVSQLRLLAS